MRSHLFTLPLFHLFTFSLFQLFILSPFHLLPFSSSALLNHIPNGRAERRIDHQVFNIEVHTITPIVTRVGWNVDAFGVGVGQTQRVVGGQPVLYAENTQH